MSAENASDNKLTVNMTVQTEVDPGWIEFVTGGPEGMVDIFLQGGYCGYWMEGIDHDEKLGWLAYEFAAEDRHCTPKERAAATKAWRENKELPKNFHALNLELARKSWLEGVKKDGVEWYENGDGCTYDCAVQRALFGEVVYG
jgi:hypothetical protein